ncbi:hypothetical protein ACF0H5_009853 [Mactra antiquata]
MAAILRLAVLFSALGLGYSLYIDGCPLYGCRPSGSFSFYLQVPRNNVSINWETQFVFDAVPKGLGCVSDSVNIVCPSNGPFSTDTGYMSLYNTNGTIRWRDTVLKFPTLPMIDNYGDVTGSDGLNLVHYDCDGKTYPIIKCYGLKPMFNMQLVGTMYLLLVSEQGGLVVRETNAIPVAEIFLNDTIQRTNGTFLPISQPVVNGQRFYLLTEFVPEIDEFDPSILNLQRLYAIDVNNRPANIMTIAWCYDFEMERSDDNFESTIATRENKIKHIADSIQGQQNVLWNSNTGSVYVALPPPYLSKSITQRSFWGFRDAGDSPALSIRSDLDVIHMATFEADTSDDEKFHSINSDNDMWIATSDVKLSSVKLDGKISRTIDVAALVGADVTMTSSLVLVRENDTDNDVLIFGANITKPSNSPLLRSIGVNLASKNFVLAIDTSAGKLLWVFSVPDDYEVKGQISGFSGASYRELDQLIFYMENSKKTAKILSIH